MPETTIAEPSVNPRPYRPDDPQERDRLYKETAQRKLQRQLHARENQKKALQMRLMGISYPIIASQLGYKNHTSAYDCVMAALREIPKEAAEQLKQLEMARLDSLEIEARKGWQKSQQDGTQTTTRTTVTIDGKRTTSVNRTFSQAGDSQFLAVLVKITERRSRLMGLDAPLVVKNGTPQLPAINEYETMTLEQLRIHALDTMNRMHNAGLLPATVIDAEFTPVTQ